MSCHPSASLSIYISGSAWCVTLWAHAARVRDKLEVAEVMSGEKKAEMQEMSEKMHLSNMEGDTTDTFVE